MKESKFEELESLLRSLYGHPATFIRHFNSHTRYDQDKPYILHDNLGEVIEEDVEYGYNMIIKYFYFKKYNIYIEIVGDADSDNISYYSEYHECVPMYEIKRTYKYK